MGNLLTNIKKRLSLKNYKNKTVLDVNLIKGGDVLWVEYRDALRSRRYKTFSGKCLSKVKRGDDTVIILRNTIEDIGVEYGFNVKSRNILEIKQVKHHKGKGGRVKRYDLRNTRIDV